MTIADKQKLELDRIHLEVQKLLDEPLRLKLDITKVILLTVAVTTAVVTAFFKILVGV